MRGEGHVAAKVRSGLMQRTAGPGPVHKAVYILGSVATQWSLTVVFKKRGGNAIMHMHY